ncbi:MAG: helix-turn-helix domain-containing protein [Lachnospiraceae bacterium]
MAEFDTTVRFQELNPKQPEFVLTTSDYSKKYLMNDQLSHFYHFTAEADTMGVIPDACTDILFWKKDGRLHTKIAGTFLQKGATSIDIKCDYFGVRFLPGINPTSGCVALSELVNAEEDFGDIIRHHTNSAQLLEEMYEAQTFDEKIRAFLKYYSTHASAQTVPEHTLKYALRDKIMHTNGDLKVQDLSDFTGYSQRYLNRRIHEEFGMSPKTLIRFVRFQKAVSQLILTLHDANGTDLAFDAGYYDQAHMIKEFIEFSGLTPSGYVKNLLGNSYDKKLHIIA